MRLSLVPSAGRLWWKVIGHRPIEDSARETVVVDPVKNYPMSPARYLPGEMDRITGVHEFAQSLTDELAQTTALRTQNMATLAHRIRNAVIGGNRVMTWTGLRDLSHRHPRSMPVLLEETLPSAALCSSASGNDFFAQFLYDDAATALLAGEFAPPVFSGGPPARSAHCRDYLAALNIQAAEIRSAFVRDLWVFQDFPFGPSKRARLTELRARLAAKYPPDAPPPGAFIRRGATGQARVLVNADEIETRLADQGFVIIDIDRQSVDEICAALSGVPLVVGVEGSHLVHGFLNMAAGGTLICIQPPDRYCVFFRHYCAAQDLNWGFVVADAAKGGFRLDPDRLMATLELVEKEKKS